MFTAPKVFKSKCIQDIWKIIRKQPGKSFSEISSKDKSSQAPSEENPGYHEIILSSGPDIFSHSLEMNNASEPAPSSLFRIIDDTKLFVKVEDKIFFSKIKL